MTQCKIGDITQPRHAKAALRDSENRYQRLFETAKDGILILDFETGQITDVNPFLIEMLGIHTVNSWGRNSGKTASLRIRVCVIRSCETSLAPGPSYGLSFSSTLWFLVPAAQIVTQPLVNRVLFLFLANKKLA